MERDDILREIKRLLQEALGPRLHAVVLFGSEARGEARPDSDIDVMVVVNGTVRWWDDLGFVLRALRPVAMRIDRPISPKVVERSDYERSVFPLFLSVRAEGVAL